MAKSLIFGPFNVTFFPAADASTGTNKIPVATGGANSRIPACCFMGKRKMRTLNLRYDSDYRINGKVLYEVMAPDLGGRNGGQWMITVRMIIIRKKLRCCFIVRSAFPSMSCTLPPVYRILCRP